MWTFEWSKVAQSAVAPVVIISACGLLCLALYNRLAAIVSRLRAFERERVEMLMSQAAAQREQDTSLEERARRTTLLSGLAQQIERIQGRAEYLRRALLCLLLAICSEVMCSLFSGLSVIMPPGAVVAAVFYLLGMILVLCGMLFAAEELRCALEPAKLESETVDELARVLKTLNGDI